MLSCVQRQSYGIQAKKRSRGMLDRKEVKQSHARQVLRSKVTELLTVFTGD